MTPPVRPPSPPPPLPAAPAPTPAASALTAPSASTGPVPARRRRRWVDWLRQTLPLLVLLLAVHVWQTRHMPSGPAPDFRAAAVSATPGATLSLAEWRAAHPGQPVLLHFWADWCPICRLEQSSISALGADAPVLTIAMQSGDAAAVQRVQAQRGLAWATVADPQAQVAALYGVRAVPALVVIDAQGHISARSVGYTSAWGMRARLWWARLRGAWA